MWALLRHGWFSAVRGSSNDPLAGPDKIAVRARLKPHLQGLIAAHPELLKGAKIVKSPPRRDYAWRIVTDPVTWTAVMSAEAAAIDYTNFKDSVHEAADTATAPKTREALHSYVSALHTVWGVGMRMQREAEVKQWRDAGRPDGAEGAGDLAYAG